MAQIIKTEEEFFSILESSNKDKSLIVVDFYTSWCGPCKILGPIFNGVAEEFKNKNVKFLKVDCEELEELSEKYEIVSIPTVKYIVSSITVHEKKGLSSKEELVETVNKYLEVLEN